MNLRILAEAEEDVQASAEWYEARGEGLGLAFLDAVTKAFASIEANPRQNPKIPAKSREAEIRSGSVTKFPYVVIDEIGEAESIVLAVAHTKRRPGFWKRRRTDI